jgi:thiosulfate/3-mercaptopyruvate sulfurtransferase
MLEGRKQRSPVQATLRKDTSMLHGILLIGITMVASGSETAGRYPRAELLIEPAELLKPAVAARFRIVDTRPRTQYLDGHLPHAVNVDHALWSKTFQSKPDVATWRTLIAKIQAPRNKAIVVYDDDLTRAARVWWILRYWGFADVRLLNGGSSGWRSADGPMHKGDENLKPLTTIDIEAVPTRLATKDLVLEALKKKAMQIIDTRSEKEYCGQTKLAKRGGAIPLAKHLEWKQVLDPKTKRFKRPSELTKLFRDAGIRVDQPATTYCQSGGRAAVMAFTLELMGARDVRNYYRSWMEWGNSEDTPVEVPDR